MKRFFKILVLAGKIILSAAICLFLLSAIQAAYRQAKITTLNHFMPSGFDYLFAVEKDPGQVKRIKLEKYELYYQKVARYQPALAEAPALLGFCQYHLGKKKKAVMSFKKAVELNPQIFWFSYNLAAIFFQEGDYPQAVQSLKTALATKPQVFLFFMSRSKIYQDLLRGFADPASEMKTRIKAGYCDAYKMLVLSFYHLKSFGETSRAAQAGLDASVGEEAFFYRYRELSLKALKELKNSLGFGRGESEPLVSEKKEFYVQLF